MSKLNGKWYFYYSEEQEDLNDFCRADPTYVDIDGEWKKYTECIHRSTTNNSNYEAHWERFEDSEFVGKVNDPEIKKGSHL